MGLYKAVSRFGDPRIAAGSGVTVILEEEAPAPAILLAETRQQSENRHLDRFYDGPQLPLGIIAGELGFDREPQDRRGNETISS